MNSRELDAMRADAIPDVVIVRKVFDRTKRVRKRLWKLKRLVQDGNIIGHESASVENDFQR